MSIEQHSHDGGNAPPRVPPFLILVTGGRDYPDRAAVFRALDTILARKGNVTVIHGACCVRGKPNELTGADRFAQEWAQEREVPYYGIPARWASLGGSAGPERNGRMVHYLPNGVVAFPRADGTWGGPTSDMIRQAEAAGVSVWKPGA